MDHSGLLQVLDELTAEVKAQVRTAGQTIYQSVIDAELTAVIDPTRAGGKGG